MKATKKAINNGSPLISAKIEATIANMPEIEAIWLWNSYCECSGRHGDQIFTMNEFNEKLKNMTPIEIARHCFYGCFHPEMNYFWFYDDRVVESSNVPLEDPMSPFLMEDIVEFIVSNRNPLWSEDIQNILNAEVAE